MTEAEWLEADRNAVLDYYYERLSPRALRLFVCACVRRVWHLLTDGRSRRAVETAECVADTQASREEQDAAHEAAWAVLAPSTSQTSAEAAAWAACETLGIDTDAEGTDPAEQRQHWYMDYAIQVLEKVVDAVALTTPECDLARRREEVLAQHRLLVDFVSPSRQRGRADSAWLACDGGVVMRLAETIYNERILPGGTLEPDRLTILADALEDAGCANADILSHLRGPGPHVRGCWALDLVLEKK